MSETIKAIPIEYFGIKIIAYELLDNELFMSFWDLCKVVGVDYKEQLLRVYSDEALSNSILKVPIEVLTCNGVKEQYLDLMNYRAAIYWLMTFQTFRVVDNKPRPWIRILKKYITDEFDKLYYHRLCNLLLSELESLVS